MSGGCDHCGRSAVVGKCGDCGIVEYCSRQCQIDAWTSHKPICATVAEKKQQRQQKPRRKDQKFMPKIPKTFDERVKEYSGVIDRALSSMVDSKKSRNEQFQDYLETYGFPEKDRSPAYVSKMYYQFLKKDNESLKNLNGVLSDLIEDTLQETGISVDISRVIMDKFNTATNVFSGLADYDIDQIPEGIIKKVMAEQQNAWGLLRMHFGVENAVALQEEIESVTGAMVDALVVLTDPNVNTESDDIQPINGFASSVFNATTTRTANIIRTFADCLRGLFVSDAEKKRMPSIMESEADTEGKIRELKRTITGQLEYNDHRVLPGLYNLADRIEKEVTQKNLPENHTLAVYETAIGVIAISLAGYVFYSQIETRGSLQDNISTRFEAIKEDIKNEKLAASDYRRRVLRELSEDAAKQDDILKKYRKQKDIRDAALQAQLKDKNIIATGFRSILETCKMEASAVLEPKRIQMMDDAPKVEPIVELENEINQVFKLTRDTRAGVIADPEKFMGIKPLPIRELAEVNCDTTHLIEQQLIPLKQGLVMTHNDMLKEKIKAAEERGDTTSLSYYELESENAEKVVQKLNKDIEAFIDTPDGARKIMGLLAITSENTFRNAAETVTQKSIEEKESDLAILKENLQRMELIQNATNVNYKLQDVIQNRNETEILALRDHELEVRQRKYNTDLEVIRTRNIIDVMFSDAQNLSRIKNGALVSVLKRFECLIGCIAGGSISQLHETAKNIWNTVSSGISWNALHSINLENISLIHTSLMHIKVILFIIESAQNITKGVLIPLAEKLRLYFGKRLENLFSQEEYDVVDSDGFQGGFVAGNTKIHKGLNLMRNLASYLFAKISKTTRGIFRVATLLGSGTTYTMMILSVITVAQSFGSIVLSLRKPLAWIYAGFKYVKNVDPVAMKNITSNDMTKSAFGLAWDNISSAPEAFKSLIFGAYPLANIIITGNFLYKYWRPNFDDFGCVSSLNSAVAMQYIFYSLVGFVGTTGLGAAAIALITGTLAWKYKGKLWGKRKQD